MYLLNFAQKDQKQSNLAHFTSQVNVSTKYNRENQSKLQNQSDTSQTALNFQKTDYKNGPSNITGMQKVEINMGNYIII
jgi:hypothetical protein